MNPGLGPARQWHALAEFITRYEANPVASALSGNLREASARRAALVRDVASDIEKGFAETHENKATPAPGAQAAGLCWPKPMRPASMPRMACSMT